MKRTHIRWETIPRDVLPDRLLATAQTTQFSAYGASLFQVAHDSVQAGFMEERRGGEPDSPRIFLLPDEGLAETSSWLKVYAPEVWPLSQYGRVLSTEDWEMWDRSGVHVQRAPRLDRWASVIVGEALAQGESDVQVASLPLARAFACYSTPVVLSLAVHGTDEASRLCVDRIRRIESDRRFARRLVGVDDLVGIWSLLGNAVPDALPLSESVSLILEAAARFTSEDESTYRYFPEARWGRDMTAFDNDSIEERVRAFHSLLQRLLLESERHHKNRTMPSAVLAAAAFLVGRGTSHQFLLSKAAKAFPAAAVWFGLLAAIAGSSAWDAEWTRASKNIERQVSKSFDWFDASGFDICWAEFSWLLKTFEGAEVLGNLPKLAQRAISVELIPGAACQFKFAVGSATEPDPRGLDGMTPRERELQAALSQFITLATRTKQLVTDTQDQSLQTSPFADRTSSAPKESKNRRNRNT